MIFIRLRYSTTNLPWSDQNRCGWLYGRPTFFDPSSVRPPDADCARSLIDLGVVPTRTDS